MRGKLSRQGTDEWETPDDFFRVVDAEFSFTLDAAVSKTNHKVGRWYSKDGSGLGRNGLDKDWTGEVVWLNPPYSNIGPWVKKAFEESKKPATIVVLLLPANTDTRWFSDFCLQGEVRLLTRGRIHFIDQNKVQNGGAPGGSMLVVFGRRYRPRITAVPLAGFVEGY